MKKLDVPYFQQQLKNDCMAACLKMIFDYYKVKHDYEAMLKAFSFYSFGLAMPQIGSLAINHALKAEIITLNPHMFNMDDIGKENKTIQTKIASLAYQSEDHHTTQKYFLEFMDNGGTLTAQIPNKEIIINSIDEGIPAFCLLASKILHNHAPHGYGFHANLVYGYDDQNFFVHDPEKPELGGGSHSIPQDLFIYALHCSSYADLDNGSILKVTR